MLFAIGNIPARISLPDILDQELVFVRLLKLEDLVEEVATPVVNCLINKVNVCAMDFGGWKKNIRYVGFPFTSERSNKFSCHRFYNVSSGQVSFKT